MGKEADDSDYLNTDGIMQRGRSMSLTAKIILFGGQSRDREVVLEF